MEWLVFHGEHSREVAHFIGVERRLSRDLPRFLLAAVPRPGTVRRQETGVSANNAKSSIRAPPWCLHCSSLRWFFVASSYEASIHLLV